MIQILRLSFAMSKYPMPSFEVIISWYWGEYIIWTTGEFYIERKVDTGDAIGWKVDQRLLF
jgi:hypothetical protein